MIQKGLHNNLAPNLIIQMVFCKLYKQLNLSDFCQAAGKGLHGHPLHCWQFVVCGLAYGGDTEGYCYPGRRFDAVFKGCIEDKTCIYGRLN